jgi:alkanesulfonate monooxygenase SsuD/methylene tetrahydromethanopterin reductase-like flavin-dependent oxidoreductase (luciferase family)
MSAELGLGIPGETALDVVAAVAARAEALGYGSFWLNDTPGADSLVGLQAAAHATSRIRLGVGVLPLDRRPADVIAADVDMLGLPQHRLVIGVGAGGLRRALQPVAAAVTLLRERTAASVVVGALGPRMRRLAAEHADGTLLNWLPPREAAAATAELRDAAAGPSRISLYVRTAIDEAATPALDEQVALYARIPAYARAFAEWGIDPADAAIGPAGFEGDRLDAYRDAVDELVIRALPAATTAAGYVDFATRVADRYRS